MDDTDIRAWAGMVREALGPLPRPARETALDALALLQDQAQQRRFEAAACKGELPDDMRDPELLALLRPGCAALLRELVAAWDRTGEGTRPVSAIDIVEGLIKRQHWLMLNAPEGSTEAELGQLQREFHEMSQRHARRCAEVDRLHAALLAVDIACSNLDAPAEAVAEAQRITQAALAAES